MKAIQILGLAFVLSVSATAHGQTYRIENRSLPSAKGELTARQAYDKALMFYRAIGKDVKKHTLHLGLTNYISSVGKTWEIVTAKGMHSDSNLTIEAKTGQLVYYRDTDIEQEAQNRPVASGVGPKLSNQAYVTNIKRFLDRAGYRQEFSPIRVTVGSRGKPRASAFIYELHKGVPVRNNNFTFSMRARDGVLDYIGRRWVTTRYNDQAKVKITEAEARETVRKTWSGKDKPVEFKLWYAQLRPGGFSPKHDIADLVYIARFANWGEVWVNAETGKVEFNAAPGSSGRPRPKR